MYNIMKSKSLFFKVILALEILRVCFPACKYTNKKTKNMLLLFEAWFSKHSIASKTLFLKFLLEISLNHSEKKKEEGITKENLELALIFLWNLSQS